MPPRRTEKDALGRVRVPADAYYGAQTQRARENFPISGRRLQRPFLRALGEVKVAAARVNTSLGLLDPKLGRAIEAAAKEVASGKHDSQFVVDLFQTGSGTSTHMNSNEVVAGRANEMLTGKRGGKSPVHPNDHVNLGQSSNDVIPTALHLSALEEIENDLLPALRLLKKRLEEKARQFKDVVKAGRTHMQDALPVTLGQEFSAYAAQLDHRIRRVESARNHLQELAIGGTAVGTGVGAHSEFAEEVVSELRKMTGIEDLRRAENPFEALGAKDAAVEASGALKTVAVSLTKIANDLRLMSSGPRAGLGEIDLPAIQPGSSIMPGKVNPVVPEAVTMACAQVIGNDAAITLGGMGGFLELNMMMPLIAYDLLESIQLLAGASRVLAERCVKGITAHPERCLRQAESSMALVTALAHDLGYDRAAKVARRVVDEDLSVKEALAKEGVSKDKINKMLDLKRLVRPHGK
ncbi:MAG: class II fumarate hydratase [Halobacteria archaeon]